MPRLIAYLAKFPKKVRMFATAMDGESCERQEVCRADFFWKFGWGARIRT